MLYNMNGSPANGQVEYPLYNLNDENTEYSFQDWLKLNEDTNNEYLSTPTTTPVSSGWKQWTRLNDQGWFKELNEQISQNVLQNQGGSQNGSPAAGNGTDITPVKPEDNSSKSEMWDTGFNIANKIGGAIGGTSGAVLQGAAQIGSASKSLAQLTKKAGGWKKLTGKQKGAGIAAIGGAAADLASAFMPEKTEYAGEKGNITQTTDSVYDGISDAAMAFGPIGMMVGGIMKGGKVLGQGLNALGGGTDAMTTTDALLGSSFLNLTPLGLINGFGGSTTNTITKNNDAFAQVGSSYMGSNATVNDALQKSGKKYGLFSKGAFNDANDEIAEAKRQQSIIEDISSEALDRNTIKYAMSDINSNRRMLKLQGGYDQSAMRVGKQGMSIQPKEGTYITPSSPDNVQEFQKGGSIIEIINETNIDLIKPIELGSVIELVHESIPEFQKGGTAPVKELTTNDISDYDSFIKYLNQTGRGSSEDYDLKGFYEDNELFPEWLKQESVNPGKAHMKDTYKKPNHFTWSIDSKGGQKFGGKWLGNDLSGWVFWASPFNMNQHTFEQYKEYWDKNEPNATLIYGDKVYRVSNKTPKSSDNQDSTLLDAYKSGGAFNVLPEGALHARKHNIDIDNITQKGIPVVSENEDGEIEQQAEIEKDELILRLSVTQKIEELKTKYYNKEATQKEKDEYAFKAGKLITEELLYNTKDNAELL